MLGYSFVQMGIDVFFHFKFSLILVPDSVPGHMIHATAVNLNPWVDYEFRVVAINNVGVGEPSVPSKPIRTKAAGKRSSLPIPYLSSLIHQEGENVI